MSIAWPHLLHHSATYWAPSTTPDGFGGFNFAAPVVIACRWQTKSKLIRLASGEEFVASAQVYPDRVLEVKGYLALGDQTGSANPKTVNGAREVRNFDGSPSVHQTDREMYRVYV